jgi:NifU-like protein
MTALTRAADARLRRPRHRGAFRPIDAARRQLGLLTVGDGQARCFWLVDLATQRIEEARFLAFGDLTSHPVADAFTELARGRTVAEACAIPAEAIDVLLRDEPQTSALAPQALAFVAGLQAQALAALPEVRLLPKPAEKQVYQRKRKQDWDAHDQAWLPLSLLRKIALVNQKTAAVLGDRYPGAEAKVEGLHDDFRVVLLLSGLATETAPTVQVMIDDALKAIHPQLRAEFP